MTLKAMELKVNGKMKMILLRTTDKQKVKIIFSSILIATLRKIKISNQIHLKLRRRLKISYSYRICFRNTNMIGSKTAKKV